MYTHSIIEQRLNTKQALTNWRSFCQNYYNNKKWKRASTKRLVSNFTMQVILSINNRDVANNFA